eukprot:3125813-Prorocentrum_lima.AAC.1
MSGQQSLSNCFKACNRVLPLGTGTPLTCPRILLTSSTFSLQNPWWAAKRSRGTSGPPAAGTTTHLTGLATPMDSSQR